MSLDIMQNQRQVCLRKSSSNMILCLLCTHIYPAVSSSPFINRMCLCSHQTALCFIRYYLQNKALVESSTTSLAWPSRLVIFLSFILMPFVWFNFWTADASRSGFKCFALKMFFVKFFLASFSKTFYFPSLKYKEW